MKFLYRILPFLIIGLILSCAKSETPSRPFVGTWTVTSLSVTGCTDTNNNYSQAFACPGTIAKWCYIYTFNSNGTCTIERTATSTEKDNGTYSVHGNFVAITFTGSNEAWTFALATNTLTFTLNDPTGNGCLYTMVLVK